MIDISFIDVSNLKAKLAALPEALNASLAGSMQTMADALKAKVQDDELSGQALNERSGRLKNSIESATESNGDVLSGSVFVGGNVPYAAILEYGGVTKAHVIEASKGKALAFLFQGKQSFFRMINHPGSDIPPHPYMEPALQAMQDDILSGMEESLAEAIVSS